jgi:hypothetical protein
MDFEFRHVPLPLRVPGPEGGRLDGQGFRRHVEDQSTCCLPVGARCLAAGLAVELDRLAAVAAIVWIIQ